MLIVITYDLASCHYVLCFIQKSECPCALFAAILGVTALVEEMRHLSFCCISASLPIYWPFFQSPHLRVLAGNDHSLPFFWLEITATGSD